MSIEKIGILQGDITTIAVDAIVNAANSSLLGGDGVDGAIHRTAGPELLHDCRLLGGCKTGQAKLTKGYDLPAKWIIHTVGPVWQDGTADEAELLTSCYRESLTIAVKRGLKTIAFPTISCGVYGYPVDQAARIAIGTTLAFLNEHDSIEGVSFVCFSDADYETYVEVFGEF
jgi:O-acetyl-ADP-ribose deacetylase